jgi:hypothetical protein
MQAVGTPTPMWVVPLVSLLGGGLAGGTEAEVKAVPTSDATQVSSVVEKFRAKYGVSDVKKYYSNFDVAVLAHIR